MTMTDSVKENVYHEFMSNPIVIRQRMYVQSYRITMVTKEDNGQADNLRPTNFRCDPTEID
jgi:hypothetical protein